MATYLEVCLCKPQLRLQATLNWVFLDSTDCTYSYRMYGTAGTVQSLTVRLTAPPLGRRCAVGELGVGGGGNAETPDYALGLLLRRWAPSTALGCER